MTPMLGTRSPAVRFGCGRSRRVLGARRIPCSAVSGRDARPARVEDVHELAASMPHVVVDNGSLGNPVYQVGGRSFVFFRNPRPDAVDPETGERYDDVIVIWVESEDDKAALVQDPRLTVLHDGPLQRPSARCSCGPVVWAR